MTPEKKLGLAIAVAGDAVALTACVSFAGLKKMAAEAAIEGSTIGTQNRMERTHKGGLPPVQQAIALRWRSSSNQRAKDGDGISMGYRMHCLRREQKA